MNEIQTELLVLLKEFDRICRDNQIKYSLHGGTLLGAVRDHGFIPWDDDIDITLFRPEFDHLIEVLNSKLLPQDFYYIRLGQTHKLVLMRRDKPLVWIDIIVYDYITDNQFLQKVKIYGLSFFRAFCRETDSLEDTKRRGKFKGVKFWLISMSCYLGKPFSSEFRNKLGDLFCKSFPGQRNLVQRSNDQFVALFMILPSHIVDEYIDIELCGSEFMISKYYHEILVRSYGDNYMVPVRFESDEESHRRSSEYIRRAILSHR